MTLRTRLSVLSKTYFSRGLREGQFNCYIATIAISCIAMLNFHPVPAQGAFDNSTLSSPSFREHKRTFGLVYIFPKEVNDLLGLTIGGLLRERLLDGELYDEALRFNISHVTVLHIHNADPTTPGQDAEGDAEAAGGPEREAEDLLQTEAAKGAGHPWWLDLGIVKEGESFEAMMAFNTIATAALTPLRDGPLPRVTGPVYAVMGDAAKDSSRTSA